MILNCFALFNFLLAGALGTLAVQMAKQQGATVVGTCSSDKKAGILKQLGADRVINYKTENIDQVLKTEYPRGIDVVFESVGGRY